MILGKTKRPRNVDSPRAAAILYGDWGTSKAYVIGLAFAVAGYSSFWLILAMSVLLALVGINYMAICRHYPDGGGVYASVYHRSKVIAIVGAFLLVAKSANVGILPCHCRSCDKRGRFPPDTRSTAEKYARKARSRKLDPSGFQVPTREHSFTGLRVTKQAGASARSGLLPV
jgi:hypothetical protein